MGEKEILTLVNKSLEAYNTSNWDQWRSTHTPNVVHEEVATSQTLTGHEEILSTFRTFKTAFPDMTGKITSSRVSGNEAITEITWTGTHKGEFNSPMGIIPPSGRSINVRAVLLQTVENDLIVKKCHHLDSMALFRQIGALPETLTKAAGA